MKGITRILSWIISIQYVQCEFTLTILHTNDVHARFREFSSRRARCHDNSRCYGGTARQMTVINQIRNTEDNVILLDAGDQFQGTVWFHVYKGKAASHFMNMLEYDAMAIGNHEFDLGIQGLIPFLKNTSFPVLSANIDARREPSVDGLFKKSTIIPIGRQKVGVIGYTTPETTYISRAGKLVFKDIKSSIANEVEKLQASGVTIIIALGHAGIDTDKDIAREVDGVDIVIGGHTNTFLYNGNPQTHEKPSGPYPLRIKKMNGDYALVVQGYAFGKYIGHLKATFHDRGAVKEWSGNPILLNSSFPKDPATLREIESWQEKVTGLTDDVIGYSETFLDGSRTSCRLRECSLGDLIADSALKSYQRNDQSVTMALVNGGSIRASIAPGNITFGDLIGVCPFGNTVDLIEIKGKHILEALEHSVESYDELKQHGKFLQVAGMRVTYDLGKPNGNRVIDVKVINGSKLRDLDLSKVYKVILPSFIVEGGDGYSSISDNIIDHHIFGYVDLDLLIEYIQRSSPLNTTIDGRIEIISSSAVVFKCQLSLITIISAFIFFITD